MPEIMITDQNGDLHNEDFANVSLENRNVDNENLQNRNFQNELIESGINHQSRSKSDSLSPKEIAIAWINLRFEAKSGLVGRRKTILRRLNGCAQFNTLNGLMGPSGSGKTILLNCLSGNGGSSMSEDSLIYSVKGTVSCFIEQNVQQCIVGRLTVAQILRYAFKFKNGLSASDQAVNDHITQTIKELMLTSEILNRFFQDCSGGEKKRIAIAQELMFLQKPSLLFVDEATTGLDSSAAFEVVKCLKSMTINYKMAVIASIHQPNSVTLSLFDQLYVLAKGGMAIYVGPPTMIRSKLIEANEFNVESPIDSLMAIACHGANNQQVQNLASSTLIQQYHQVSSQIQAQSQLQSSQSNHRKSFSLTDLYLQCSRMFRVTFIANRQTFLLCTLLYVVNFILVATIFNSSGKSSGCNPLSNYSISCSASLELEVDYKENLFNIAYTLLYVGFIISYVSTVVFSENVRYFRVEHRNSWYSLGVFYWSSMIINFLEITFYGILVSFLAYFLSFQHAADDYAINWNRFGRYSLFLWLFCVYVQNFGQLFGVLLVDSPDLAIILSIVYYNFVSIANGLFVNLENNHNPAIAKGTDVVAMKFISKGILYALYGVDRCDFDQEYSVILNFFHLTSDDMFYYIKWILANIVAFRLFTYACLYAKFGNFSSKKSMKSDEKYCQMIRLDFENISISRASSVLNMSAFPFHGRTSSNSSSIKSENRSSSDSRSSNKILVGWRNLVLYPSSSWVLNSNSQSEKKQILQNLNGQLCFGTLTAVMGPSGCGKTSLLKVLNGQCNDRLSDTSRLYLSKCAQIQTCFITQDVSDHLQTGLTVKQLLLYASRLKNHVYYDGETREQIEIDHSQIVNDLLAKFGLEDTVDTKVEMCSGGERKRIALALELTSLQMPNLICIDEPTSGLDSNSAEIVISYLRNIVKHHNTITIVISIHQPNLSTLCLFDSLYVLAQGGVCVYSGPPKQIDQYLTFKLAEFPDNQIKFPIERLILLSCANSSDVRVETMRRITDKAILVENSKLELETSHLPNGILQTRIRFSLQSSWTLMQRYLSHMIGHQWKEFLFFTSSYFIYGLLLKLFYNFDEMVPVSGCLSFYGDFNTTCQRTAEEGHNTIYQLTENSKYLFFFCGIYMLFIFLQSTLNFRKDFNYFRNEHRNGWYSTGSFYLTKTLTEMLQVIPINLIYVYICAHYYEDVRPGHIYWNYVAILCLSTIAMQGLSHILAIIFSENLYAQLFVSMTIYLFSVLLGNFYIPFVKLHYIYQFIANLSVVRYCYEAMMILLYGLDRCGPKEIQRVMYMMKLEDDHLYTCIGMLLFNLVLYRLISIYLLIRKVNLRESGYARNVKIEQFQEKP